MSRRHILLPIVLGLSVGLLWILWSTDLWTAVQGTTPADGDGTSVKNTKQATGPATADVDSTTSRVTLAVEDPSTEPEEYRRWLSGLSGRLIWKSSGDPIPNVEVRAIETWLDTVTQSLDDVKGVLGAGDPFVLKGTGRTDADGNFHIAGLHSRAFLLLGIGLGTDKAAVRVVNHAPGPGESVDMGDILLSERGTVVGQAVDSDGKPVAGARVRILDLSSSLLLLGIQHYDPQGLIFLQQGAYHLVFEIPPWVRKYDSLLPFGDARTGTNGRFVVKGVRPGRSTLMILKRGLATTTKAVRPQPLAEVDVGSIEVREGGTLEGSFRQADGKPVTGVRVAAGSLLNLAPFGFLCKPVPVDSSGRFAFSGLPRGRLWLAHQRRKGQPWKLTGPYSDGEEVHITLEDLATATVRVEDDRGTPLDDVKFTLFVRDQAAWVPGYEQRIDTSQHFHKKREPGVWEVRNLPPATYTLVAEAPRHALASAVLTLGKGHPDPLLVIQLPPSNPQQFLVVNQAAEPVAGARIYWDARNGRASKDTSLWKTPLLLGSTDKGGSLEISGLEAGASRFLCRHPGYALATSGKQVTRFGVPIRFVLGPGGHVQGSIRENGGRPLTSHTLMASPRGSLREHYGSLLMGRFTRSMPDGSFTFRHLDPGEWRIDVLSDFGENTSITEFLPYGGSPFRSRLGRDITVTANNTTFLHLELTAEDQTKGRGSLVGTILLAGKPAEGVRVETWSGGQRAIADANGRFALEGLAEGKHWIGVEAPAHGMVMNRLWEGTIEIHDGSQETLHLDLPVASARIQIEDPKGHPLAGLLVELQGQLATQGRRQGKVQSQAITDATGGVLFQNVPEGRYRVRNAAGRQASWAFPPTNVNLFGSGTIAKLTIRAMHVIHLVGSVEYDLSGLDAAGKKLANENKPTWLVFEDAGHYIWGPVHRHGEKHTFAIPGVAPGTYRYVNRSKVPWTTQDLVVPVSGLRDAKVVLRAK